MATHERPFCLREVCLEDRSVETLSSIFCNGLKLHETLQSSTDDPQSDNFQHLVRKAILLLEDATRMVSMLDVFSLNEDVSELPTESIKYLLLPALLGDLNGKLAEDHERRLQVLNTVETYYMDFLQRIKDYGILTCELPDITPKEPSKPGPPNLGNMNSERNAKLKRFKEKKALEDQLKNLKVFVDGKNESRDEESVRNYYLKLVRSFALSCLDDISSYEMEKSILSHMSKVKKGEVAKEEARAKSRPLRPIVIAKDKIQKEIFGMGYRNLPVLTIEEFYEQRVRDGWFPDPAKVQANSLMDRATTHPDLHRQPEEENERIEERKVERDDLEELQRKRAMDEYKDTHKRGEGNRHNKG